MKSESLVKCTRCGCLHWLTFQQLCRNYCPTHDDHKALIFNTFDGGRHSYGGYRPSHEITFQDWLELRK